MADTPAAPASSDYRDAAYWENLGKIEHTLNTTLAGDKETLSNAETSYAYNNSLISQNEPGRFAANRYRAVNEGIAQSGVNTGRRGALAAGFQGQRNKLTTGLTEQRTRVGRNEQEARDRKGIEEAGNTRTAQERQKQRLERTNPNEPPPAPAAPAEARLPGGGQAVVRPYQEPHTYGGNPPPGALPTVIRQIPQPSTRAAAARKAARR